MQPADCKSELLTSNGDDLKSRVGEALGEGAAYVLVNSEELNPELIDDRVEKMKEAIRESSAEIDVDTADLDVLDATKIVDWARKYPSVITLIRQLTNQPQPAGFVRWEDWEKEWTQNPGFTASLAAPDEVDRNMEWIRARVSEGGRSLGLLAYRG